MAKTLMDRVRKSIEGLKGRRPAFFKADVDVELWRAKAGDHIIDVIPYKAGSNDPDADKGDETYTFEMRVHYIGPEGNMVTVICPAMYGKKCPVCELDAEIKSRGEESNYYPRRRNLYNIVCYDDRKERKKGVQVWDVATHYFEKNVLAIARVVAREGEEEKITDFANAKHGKSISFKIKTGGKYDEHLGHAFRSRNYKIDKEILKQAHVLDELVQVLSYKEIKKILDGAIAEENETEASAGNEDGIQYNFTEMLSDLGDIDDIEELEEYVDDKELESIGFDAIDTDEDFDSEKLRLIDFINDQLGVKTQASGSNDFSPKKLEELLAQLKELSDIEELVVFVEDNELSDLGIDVDEDSSFVKEKVKFRKALKEAIANLPKQSVSTKQSVFDPEEALAEAKKAKSNDALEKIIRKYKLIAEIDPAQHYFKNRKTVKNAIEDLAKGATQPTPDSVETASFKQLQNMVKTVERLTELIDLEDYEDVDVEELRQDILQVLDDIPF